MEDASRTHEGPCEGLGLLRPTLTVTAPDRYCRLSEGSGL